MSDTPRNPDSHFSGPGRNDEFVLYDLRV
ncbi:MAG: hypothetical protein JWP52_1767, partial [Rhizobacter sp.]|nr:hypothetical protein [Rhizobacter sp.]